jgi:hypothetical protein
MTGARPRGLTVSSFLTGTGPGSIIDLTRESIGRREQAAIRAAGFWAAGLALVGTICYVLSVPLQIASMLSPSED